MKIFPVLKLKTGLTWLLCLLMGAALAACTAAPDPGAAGSGRDTPGEGVSRGTEAAQPPAGTAGETSGPGRAADPRPADP
ncbi:MAG: hypothetical protein LBQ16_07600, partial [Gracilibacteraceae bacterium]|nr:hypothetical protein [Gracilibacteraceae bacterium]